MDSTICYVTAAVKRAINDNRGISLIVVKVNTLPPPPPPPTVNSLCKKNGERDTKLTSLLIVVIKISKDQKIQTRSNRKI